MINGFSVSREFFYIIRQLKGENILKESDFFIRNLQKKEKNTRRMVFVETLCGQNHFFCVLHSSGKVRNFAAENLSYNVWYFTKDG